MSLRQIAIGSAAMSSSTILRMLFQIFIIPVLARYLTPHDYGIVAIAMPFVMFAMMFSDAGISASLIRSTAHTHNDTEWSTSFWLTAGLGAALAIAISICGYAAALFLNEPSLGPIIAALSLIIVFQSSSTVPGAKLQQTGQFTQVALIEITSMIISLTITVIAAMHGAGAWALVIQQITQFLPRVTLTMIASPFKPKMLFDMTSIKDHLHFGKHMLGMNIINYARITLVNTLTGKFQGTANVGMYAMANLFSELPNRVVSGPVQNVIYPRMAGLKDQADSIRTLYLFITRLLAIAIIPGLGVLAAAHTPVFTFVLSEKWAFAGFIFMILTPAAMIQTVTALRSTIAMAHGRTDILMRQSIEQVALNLIVFAATVHFGIEWVAAGISVVALGYIPRSLKQIFRLIDLKPIDYIGVLIVPVLMMIAAILCYGSLSGFYTGNLEKIILAILCAGFAAGISLLAQLPQIRDETHKIRGFISHSRS